MNTKMMVSMAFAVTASAVWAMKFEVVRDHADCLYKCGETATFTVTGKNDDGSKATAGTVKWSLDSYNVGDKLAKGEIDLAKENPFTVKGALQEPGFLQLMLAADGFKIPFNTGGWSVGYEPERIRKGSPSPKDFDAFWAAGRKRLAKEVPLDVKIVPYPEKSTKDWNYYRISFATFGRRVYGFFSTPTDVSKKKFPARVHVASAGWGDWTNFQPGKKDMVYLWLSVYPFEPSWDWKTDGSTEKYNQMNKDCAKKWGWGGYGTAGISGKRDDYFFYAVTLGMDRAVDWLATHPMVDASDITYFGGSQSGGLGLYLVGLNHRFRKAVTTVPALTDTMAHVAGRVSSWPRAWESAPKAYREACDCNLPYYDAANFASRVKCPIRLTVGFRDGTCFPPCVYAAYNEIKVKDKQISHALSSGHGMPDVVIGPLGDWLKAK